LIKENVMNATPVALGFAPRANGFLLEGRNNEIHYWQVENEHPEVSLKSIWQKVWYESYPKPDYIWQSSSASNDFEPKMSLTPLSVWHFQSGILRDVGSNTISFNGSDLYCVFYGSGDAPLC
jgi:ABC-type uncharacterized transport system permease subunit